MSENQNQLHIEFVQNLINQGHLTSTGDLTLYDKLLIDNPDDDTEPNKFGLFGEPTEYFGRRLKIAEQIINEWSQSSDPFKRLATTNAPKYFVFPVDKAELDEMSEGNRAMYAFSANSTFSVDLKDRCIQPYKFLNNSNVSDHWFFSFRGTTTPSENNQSHRDSLMTDEKIADYVTAWLDNIYKKLISGGKLEFGK